MTIPEIKAEIDQLKNVYMELNKLVHRLNGNIEELRKQLGVERVPSGPSEEIPQYSPAYDR